jgi:hypothetical protein
MRRSQLLWALLFLFTSAAHAIEVRISSDALERTLRNQLFNTPDGRYYLRGDAKSPCFVYAEKPRVTFDHDRVVVHLHTRARLGTHVYGSCVGVSLTRDVDVSILPDAQGETIGFRDARIDHLSDSRELNFLLVPFLSAQLPQQMKVNAADLMRQLLSRSAETTGYSISLTALKIHSMIVEGSTQSSTAGTNNSQPGPMLVLDVDAGMSVH